MDRKFRDPKAQSSDQRLISECGRNPKTLTGENRERANGRPTEDDRAVKWTDQTSGLNSNT